MTLVKCRAEMVGPCSIGMNLLKLAKPAHLLILINREIGYSSHSPNVFLPIYKWRREKHHG